MFDKIYIAGIENDSITDGPGLRITIFTQGCDKRCKGCHNPASIPMHGGEEKSADDLIEKISSNPLLTGVTISGGEPLLQAKALIPVVRWARENDLDLAVYTGDVMEDILARDKEDELEFLSYANTLIDGPYIKAERSLSLPFRGSTNQRILNVPESLHLGVPVIETDERWY